MRISKTGKFNLEAYDYQFPQELIAQQPAVPRDSARLLVYNRKTDSAAFDTFKNLSKYLPPKAVLVFNETKVIPARVELQKATGGKVKILYLERIGGLIKVMADRQINIGSRLFLKKKPVFLIEKQTEQFYFLKPLFLIQRLNNFFETNGVAPLPPYIKHSPLGEAQIKREYQAVFAKYLGSIAAPTASLHFTKSLLRTLKQRGFSIEFVTLHVNLGTFAPLTDAQLQNGKLHQEYYEISSRTAERLNRFKKDGRQIVAVGTTVVRTLESASDTAGILKKLSGATDLFIRPGYRFNLVDSLITNFHVPRSSLLMLAAAFSGREELFKLYQKAIQRKFRLFSFGDGMLII